MTRERGTLIVLSGPSGSGKSTAMAELLRRRDNYYFSISATTRDPRPGEQNGVNYWFVSRERFEEMVSRDELLEHAEYVGNCYGTPAAPIDAALEQGKDVLLDIEVQGAMQVRSHRPDAVLIFMVPPSYEELSRRLNGRGDTPPDKVKARLEKALQEIQLAPDYDYIVVSETVEGVANEIQAIIDAEKCRAARRAQIVKEDFSHALSTHG